MIVEAIILKISWHYETMKTRDNRKTRHVEKKLIVSNNKNNNYNSNNNDLKDGQNHGLEKK